MATENQKAAVYDQLRKYKDDESYNTKRVKCFNEADADGDGRLNLAEYRNFEAAMR